MNKAITVYTGLLHEREKNINTYNVLPLPMEGDRHHLKVHHPALCLGDMNLNFQETQACKKIQEQAL